MKRLFLLRHAKAMPSEGGSDIDRHLAPKGIEDARALGSVMDGKNYHPAAIFCSPSVRTKETLSGIMENLPDTKTYFEHQIYNAGRADLFRMIQSADPELQSIMLVGHNPAMHEVAAMLAAEGDGQLITKLVSKFSPGTLCVLDCPSATWMDIQPAENQIVDYLSPDEYNDPARPTRWM